MEPQRLHPGRRTSGIFDLQGYLLSNGKGCFLPPLQDHHASRYPTRKRPHAQERQSGAGGLGVS